MTIPMHHLQTVGEIVRLLRARRSLEQVELARACGWRDASAVSRIETDRIHPTRKTLLKLAENLADGGRGGSVAEVRAWLFLAAGLLPARDEITRLVPSLPPIERWAHPAALTDFGWNLWRANSAMIDWLGLPTAHEGRNFIEMMLSPQVRHRLGESWRAGMIEVLTQFRGESEHQARQRWYRSLLTTLERHPDFGQLWPAIVAPSPSDMLLRTVKSTTMGSVSIVRVSLSTDPRLTLTQVIAQDDHAPDAPVGVRLHTTLEPRTALSEEPRSPIDA